MSEHQHDYRKLNDEAVFCRGCGDIKSVAAPVCALPHYPMYPAYPVPYQPHWYPWWTVTSTSTYADVTIGDTAMVTGGTS